MESEKLGLCAVIGVGVVIALYFATQNDGNTDRPVPAIQGEAQMMGLGLSAGIDYGAGTPLDMRPEIHFWAPGFNERDSNSPQPTVQSAHRYPVVPGGNVTTVMHKGFSSLMNDAPQENDWFRNPPEVAVI